MILAAAIKYKVKATNKIVILCGARHGNVFDQIHALGLKEPDDIEEIEQGFIDHKNKFLTREQAYKHAKRCGQLADKLIYDYEKTDHHSKAALISEDLW